jgi:hypothetical protein
MHDQDPEMVAILLMERKKVLDIVCNKNAPGSPTMREMNRVSRAGKRRHNIEGGLNVVPRRSQPVSQLPLANAVIKI